MAFRPPCLGPEKIVGGGEGGVGGGKVGGGGEGATFTDGRCSNSRVAAAHALCGCKVDVGSATRTDWLLQDLFAV